MAKIFRLLTRKTKNSWKVVTHFDARNVCFYAVIMLFLGVSCAHGQITLGLSSASAITGGGVSLNLSMSAAAGSAPADLEWTFSYSTTDFTAVSVVAGPAALAADKSLACNGSVGSYTCLLFGINSNTINSGVIATATFTVSPATTSTSSAIQLVNNNGAAPNASLLSVTPTGGQVTISPAYTITALACTPASITTPAVAGCSVTVSSPAPTGGLGVATGMGGGTASVTIPSSITVPAGSTTAGFTADVSSVSASTTTVLVASLSGSSKSVWLTLLPPPASDLTELTCSATTLVSHASTTCTVTLSNPAPSGGVTVALNSGRLSAPSSVLIPAGSTSAQFSVSVGNINTTQTATIGAALNGASCSFSITLIAPTAKHH